MQYFNTIPFPKVKYVLYRKIGKQYFYSKNISPLKGTHEILIHQNLMADADRLERIQNDSDLNRLRDSGELVKIPFSGSLLANPLLHENRRYCRPWAATFLTDFSSAFHEKFGGFLEVNSAVRTVPDQLKLARHNSNAAATDGNAASPHLTGQAIDITKKNLSLVQIKWIRAYLLNVRNTGTIDVEEEFHQSCFHISVYSSYIQKNNTI